jgi:archaellum component FlaD/FlaE
MSNEVENEDKSAGVDSGKPCSSGLIDGKLAELHKHLPNHLIKELENTLKAMPLSEKQCNSVIEKTVSEFERRKTNMNAINDRITGIESSIVKLTHILEGRIPPQPKGKAPIEATVSKDPKCGVLNEMVIINKPNTELLKKIKPKLEMIDEGNIKNIVVMLKWIEFLMERVGRENLLHTLEFYADIGWLSNEVISVIIGYIKGVNIPQNDSNGLFVADLTVKDHIQSLLYIEKLCGNDIDRQMLSMIEREISSIKKGSEEIYGI